MSRLAEEFISKNFSLPRPIKKIEHCLANAYILCSIARQLHILSEEDFEQVSDTEAPDDIMHNFQILSKSLHKLEIKMTRKDIANVSICYMLRKIRMNIFFAIFETVV